MKNFGTIIEQRFVKSFQWNGKDYNNYIIRFKEYEGLHLINRCVEHEQALIGAQIMFDYSNTQGKVVKYRIINYIPIEELQKNSQ